MLHQKYGIFYTFNVFFGHNPFFNTNQITVASQGFHIACSQQQLSLLPLAETADPDARGAETDQPTAEGTQQGDPGDSDNLQFRSFP